MTTNRRQAVGKWGEDLAEQIARQRGYTILARNVRTPYGELDLVASKDGALVFIEVKTRTGLTFGLPEAAITPKKQAHLVDAARHYLLGCPAFEGDWRIDVIAIIGRPGQNAPPQVEWIENALA